jgi:hypothetical protein
MVRGRRISLSRTESLPASPLLLQNSHKYGCTITYALLNQEKESYRDSADVVNHSYWLLICAHWERDVCGRILRPDVWPSA